MNTVRSENRDIRDNSDDADEIVEDWRPKNVNFNKNDNESDDDSDSNDSFFEDGKQISLLNSFWALSCGFMTNNLWD